MKKIIFTSVLVLILSYVNAQKNATKDTTQKKLVQKFNEFNKKAEEAFKILPFPMITYAQETGWVFGLVKYNMIQLVKGDTISPASSFSELVSWSTSGQKKAVLGSNMFFANNTIWLKAETYFIEYPEYILGTGNDVKREDVEMINTKRFSFNNAFLYSLNKKNSLYIGIYQEYENYLSVEKDSTSYLIKENYPGKDGGISSGWGFGFAYDTRDNRFNATKGVFIEGNMMAFGRFAKSGFSYNSYFLDIRKYFKLFGKHVVAMQVRTLSNYGTVPFYSLAKMGGSENMRGYYLGALRDKVMFDSQIEYRLHIWNIFGMVAFAGAGRVAPSYNSLNFNDLWYSGGIGLRIMVDTRNRANLRIDFAYGQYGAKAIVLGFTEAF